MSNRQAYLKNEHPELRIIGGIGEFAAHLPALPVPDSIAHQYDTDEMRAQGWVVRWVEHDHGAFVGAHGDAPGEEGGAASPLPFRAGAATQE